MDRTLVRFRRMWWMRIRGRMILFTQNAHSRVQNLQNLYPTSGNWPWLKIMNRREKIPRKSASSQQSTIWVRNNNRVILFPNNKKISTTRDDWDSKPGLIAWRKDDMWRKVQFNIDSRSCIFLHVKKYLNKNLFLRMKKVRTTVFFIPEQQKDFYHKKTEIPNEA